LVYSSDTCNEKSFLAGYELFKNNDSILYKAPVIATGEETLNHFLAYRIRYPSFAMNKGITGKVYLKFSISAEGLVENICVTKGVHVVLDKEAVRVIRLLKFSSPPKVNGKSKGVCVSLPVNFRLA
jgi:protein TonB